MFAKTSGASRDNEQDIGKLLKQEPFVLFHSELLSLEEVIILSKLANNGSFSALFPGLGSGQNEIMYTKVTCKLKINVKENVIIFK